MFGGCKFEQIVNEMISCPSNNKTETIALNRGRVLSFLNWGILAPPLGGVKTDSIIYITSECL